MRDDNQPKPRTPLLVPAIIACTGLVLGLAAGVGTAVLTSQTASPAAGSASSHRTDTSTRGGSPSGSPEPAPSTPSPGHDSDGTPDTSGGDGSRDYGTVGEWLDSSSGRMLVEQAPVGLEYFGMSVRVSAESEDTIRYDYVIDDPSAVAAHMAAISSSYALELPDADRQVATVHGVRAHAVVKDRSGRTVYDHLFDANGPVS